MAQFLRIAIGSPDEASRRLIQRVATEHKSARVVAETDDDARLVEIVEYRRPQLVFISADLGDMRGYAVADRLSREHPGLFIVMLTPRQGIEELRRAMKAGARECLFEPLTEAAVARVLDEARDVATAVAGRRGAIVGVMSSKGGVGKSTLATNLSIALQQQNVGRIALVDGDLYFGDVAMLLNMRPERTIQELNAALDAEIADRFLYRHSSGVEVLAAPLRTEQAEEIGAERFRAILAILQGLYDYVVVDATVSAFDTMLATLDVADLAILLTTLDVVCLKDVNQILDMLNRLRFPAHNVMVVGNRYDERVSLNPREAERVLGVQFTSVIPQDDRVIAATNRGVPLILSEPRAPFSQRVTALSKTVAAHIGRVDRVPAQTS
ncbi:MAG: P-loop NTPase [Armatimonadota bacterium]|nr:P-loop NTPase [Armatimonadota bacterium]